MSGISLNGAQLEAPPQAHGLPQPGISEARVFNPEENGEAVKLVEGTIIKLRGTLKSVEIDSNRRGDYAKLIFSESNSMQGRASTWQDFEVELNESTFEKYIGSEIIIEGPSFHAGGRRNHVYVMIKSLDQITVVER